MRGTAMSGEQPKILTLRPNGESVRIYASMNLPLKEQERLLSMALKRIQERGGSTLPPSCTTGEG